METEYERRQARKKDEKARAREGVERVSVCVRLRDGHRASKSMKALRLRAPMQLLTNTQWWSMRNQHVPQSWQWWHLKERGSFRKLGVLFIVYVKCSLLCVCDKETW